MPKLTIIFPSSYFSIHKVDEDLQAEYDAVIETGLFDVVLFSYDKWFSEGRLVLDNEPDDFVRGVYRGWMMKPEIYKDFYEQLADKKIRLMTDPKEYELFHIFPNIYPRLAMIQPRCSYIPTADTTLMRSKRPLTALWSRTM